MSVYGLMVLFLMGRRSVLIFKTADSRVVLEAYDVLALFCQLPVHRLEDFKLFEAIGVPDLFLTGLITA